MKIRCNPLVVAAALGLLGPAALADDELNESRGVEGLWTRVEPAEAAMRSAALGDQIEMIPVEDRLVFDDGTGVHDDGSHWIRLDARLVRQELVVDGTRVVREFRADGDELAVRTQVGDDEHAAWLDRYTRIA